MLIGHDDAGVDESSGDDVDHIQIVGHLITQICFKLSKTNMQECPQQCKITTNCEIFTSFLSSASSSAQLPLTFTRFLALGLEMSQVLILHKIKPRFQNLNQVKLF